MNPRSGGVRDVLAEIVGIVPATGFGEPEGLGGGAEVAGRCGIVLGGGGEFVGGHDGGSLKEKRVGEKPGGC